MNITKGTVPYIKDPQGNKHHSDIEKELILRKTWENVFKITPEENQKFDPANEETVNSFIIDNWNRTQPYETVDLNRLSGNNPLP